MNSRHKPSKTEDNIHMKDFIECKLAYIYQTATTLRPLTVEVNTTDHHTKVQYSTGKPRILALIGMPPDTEPSSKTPLQTKYTSTLAKAQPNDTGPPAVNCWGKKTAQELPKNV